MDVDGFGAEACLHSGEESRNHGSDGADRFMTAILVVCVTHVEAQLAAVRPYVEVKHDCLVHTFRSSGIAN